jgi:hypothetical protein
MKPEIDRVKNDLETIERAMGIAPSLGQDWLQWLKRDKWFSLWWCVPGLLLIAATLAPLDHARKVWGFAIDQWAGILVVVAMLTIARAHIRKVTGKDGRSEHAIREAKRMCGIDRQGFKFRIALLVQVAAYFYWGIQYDVAFEPFWAGLFIVTGSTCLAVALSAKAWTLLGWAIPFLAYGLGIPFTGGTGKLNGVLFGMMFILVALSFSLIQVLEIRKFESENATH